MLKIKRVGNSIMFMNLFKNKKDKRSIYKILNEYTTNGILDYREADEILNPRDDDKIKISSGFLDQFGIDKEVRISQVESILNILKQINNDKLKKTLVVEEKLLEINFANLNVIDELISQLDDNIYSEKTYEIFKEILFTTDNKEIFKFAIDMTGAYYKCSELIEDYLIIGQAEEFTRYISYVLCNWRDDKNFKDGLFYLLQINSDWGAINIAKMLALQEDIMEDINNQRQILIGALENNCIQMEVAYHLGCTLNISKLFEKAQNDKELMKYLIELFYTLFFETNPHGGLLDMKCDIEYLNLYIENVQKTKFEALKLLGLKNIIDFLNDKKNEEFIKEETEDGFYENFKSRVQELWNSTYSIEFLRQAISEKENIYAWIEYTKENNIIEVIPDFEKIYLESNEVNENLESLLISLGSNNIIEKIYSDFKLLYNEEERSKNQYSYTNVGLCGEKYKEERKIISKVEVLGIIKDEEALELIEKLLEDYNPQMRAKAMVALEDVEEEKIKERPQLVEKLIRRLGDKPEYIKKYALKLCKDKTIEIPEEQ